MMKYSYKNPEIIPKTNKWFSTGWSAQTHLYNICPIWNCY